MERDLLTKQIELTALSNEDDEKSIARRNQVDIEVKTLKQKLDNLTSVWQSEKDELERAKTVQERLETAKIELEVLQGNQYPFDFNNLSNSNIISNN